MRRDAHSEGRIRGYVSSVVPLAIGGPSLSDRESLSDGLDSNNSSS